jgi:hypothetical protein
MTETKRSSTKAGPIWALSGDHKSVTVTFPTNPPVSLTLDAAGVEDMLRNLGEFRSEMKPEISAEYPAGRIDAIRDPMWMTRLDPLQGDSIVHIRDLRYGWLHYVLPAGDAGALGGFLQKQAEAGARSAPPTQKN